MKKTTWTVGGNKLGKNIVISTMISLASSILLSGVTAFVILSETIPETAVGIFSLLITFISVFLGCLYMGKTSDNKVAVYTGVAAAIYFVLTAAFGILLFDSALSGLLANLMCILAGYGGACALCIRKRPVGRNRKRRNW